MEKKLIPIEVLMVEDNPGDVRLTVEAFKENKVLVNLNVVSDGVEAMSYLHKEGKYRTAIHPDLILLDLNLPKKNGREVLEEIKTKKNLKCIPVVILTTSKDEEDILKSYNLYANSYITKPVDFEQFIKVVKSFNEFWLTIAKLPPKKD